MACRGAVATKLSVKFCPICLFLTSVVSWMYLWSRQTSFCRLPKSDKTGRSDTFRAERSQMYHPSLRRHIATALTSRCGAVALQKWHIKLKPMESYRSGKLLAPRHKLSVTTAEPVTCTLSNPKTAGMDAGSPTPPLPPEQDER